ncbi:MAG: protoporphyrinogen oxidase [Brachybacterium sp.]|nr:protoporphyrinogen oxidase [Brachybacterium sp.]
MSPRVVVVGGGLAGLLAARRHSLAGAQVTLLEAEPDLGGAVAAAEVAGLEVNTGAEAYGISSGAVDQLIDELGLTDQVVEPAPSRSSRIVSAGGRHRSPTGGLLGIPARPCAPDVRAVIGGAGALRAAVDRLLPAGYGLRDGVTVGDYVRRRMGRRVAERLVAPIIGGVYSADPDTLELTTVQPRLPAAVRETGSLAGAVRRLRPASGSGRSPGTAVRSLRPTMAELPRALAAAIEAAGGTLRTRAAVTALAREEDGTWLIGVGEDPGTTATATAPEILAADHLVLATTPDQSTALLADALPVVAAAIPEAPSAPIRLVALALDAPALDDSPAGTGALVAPGTPGIRAKALTHASGKWDHVRRAAREAIGPSGHIVRLSYGRPGEELPETDGLVELALVDASRILGVDLDASHLRGSRVITWTRAMRQARVGHREALDQLTRVLTEDRAARGLELVGSWRDGTGLDAVAAAARTADPAHPAPPSEGSPA